MRPKSKSKTDDEIIVRRRSKRGHGEQHGGAWKVAFADFTLAMMALFMVLWIIQPQRKAETASADALVNPLVDGGAGVFDGFSKTPIDFDGIPQPRKDTAIKAGETLTEEERKLLEAKKLSLDELAVLMNTLAKELNAEANLAIEIVPQGLRILIKDADNNSMFERGSARLNPAFNEIVSRVAKTVNRVDNKIIISGHTDATPYANNSQYNNWNLSGDRALAARNRLETEGLANNKILQVTAQADTTPANPENPTDGSNRRIELLVLTTQAEALYMNLFGQENAKTVSP